MVHHHFILKIEKVLLGEESDDIFDSTGAAKKKIILTLVKQVHNFVYVCLHYNGDESCK